LLDILRGKSMAPEKTTRKTRPAKDEKKKEPARKTSSATSPVAAGKRRSETARRRPAAHDPEQTLRRGMTAEAAAEDEAETMASTGDSEGTELSRKWTYELASGEMDWEDVRQAARDAWNRARRLQRRR
jgi:hypothetical protein